MCYVNKTEGLLFMYYVNYIYIVHIQQEFHVFMLRSFILIVIKSKHIVNFL